MERRLGRGLGSLLSAPPTATEPRTEVELHRIRPNPFQPRRTFDEAALEELRASIERHGVLQPVVVRPVDDGYELVSGERRWRAAGLAGREKIPAVVRSGVRDDEMLELALVENVQRRDLDPIERAEGYRQLQETLGLTQEGVAERVGLRRSTVTNHLRLLDLPEEVQDAVRQDLVSMGHARALLGLPGAGDQKGLLAQIVRKGLSVRDVERRVRERMRRPAASVVPTPAQEAPPWVRELEGRLREALGTKVRLENKAGTRGQIVLEYYDRAGLEALLERLAPRPTL